MFQLPRFHYKSLLTSDTDEMKSHLKAWMPNVFTNPFIKGRICNSDTKRPALTSIGRRKVSAHSCEHLVTGTGDNCPFGLLY